jgi:DNA-binding response OmpR family regulator
MRILVVEDEHRIAQSIKQGLEQETYAVDVCYDGQEGLDFATSEDYDIIVLDRMLPSVDGVEICKKLRTEGIHTPVLMLTAKGQVEDRVEGLDAGADDYLVKPFAFEELLARLRALKRRPKKKVEDILRLEDLSLNTQTYEVKRKDRTIKLSQKEFALLEYLLRNAEKTLTKEQIISHVWNYDADILPNTLEAFIKQLRNKVDREFSTSQQLIKTVRGFGYKISSEK